MTSLTIFDGKASVPAHIAQAFKGKSNLVNDRVTVPTLSYEGKVWTVGLNGEKHKIMRSNEDGDQEPASIMQVVILDYNKRRGRAFYEGAYDPSKPGVPLCWSDDGVAPHVSVEKPICGSCQTCPKSMKGSRITEQGKAAVACSQFRMLVVAPVNRLNQPLRMKLAITSDYDKNNPEAEAQGWYAFHQYTEKVKAGDSIHTAAFVTKMRFDPNVAYPKVQFSGARWLTPEETQITEQMCDSEAVKKLLAGTYTPAGIDGKLITQPVVEAYVAPTPAPAPAPVVKTVTVNDLDDDEEIVVEERAAPKKAAPKKAAPKPAPTTSSHVDTGLDDVLSAWGDD